MRGELLAVVREERAQGSLEYILLAGAIIVGLIIVIPFYRSAADTSARVMNTSVETTQAKFNQSISEELSRL